MTTADADGGGEVNQGEKLMQKYMVQVLKQADQIDKAGVWRITVKHDSWCSIFHGGDCNCDPVVDEPERSFCGREG